MTVRAILPLGEDRLRARCDEVRDPSSAKTRAVVEDLRDTLEETYQRTGYGRGIAAPQIGEQIRVVYLSKRVLGEELVLINPRVVERSEEMITTWDSCLCFLSIFMRVDRHREIVVEYEDLEGFRRVLRAGAERDLSELLQHEIDHLDGVLCIDLVRTSSDIVTREVFEKRYREGSPYAEVRA